MIHPRLPYILRQSVKPAEKQAELPEGTLEALCNHISQEFKSVATPELPIDILTATARNIIKDLSQDPKGLLEILNPQDPSSLGIEYIEKHIPEKS